MPTVLAHAGLGAALGAFAPRGLALGRLALLAALAAVLPDLDVASFALGVPYGHPLGHRGLTHGLPFALATGALLAPLAAPGVGWRGSTRLAAAALLALATASHGLLDAATDAGRGVGLFVPFADARIFWPWRPFPTSPIGVADFLRGDAGRILAFELRALGPPALALVLTGLLLRGRRRRAEAAVAPPPSRGRAPR